MGCDIHTTIEVLRNGEWSDHDWEAQFVIGLYEDGERQIDWQKAFDHPLYIGRNYDLFAILADVRNGRGFAGFKTGDGFNPISLPRGLPADASAAAVSRSESYGEDGHSHSWLTLAELLAFDWTQTTKHQGYVDAENFQRFSTEGKPQEWSSMVSGGNVRHVENTAMRDALIRGDDTKHLYTLVKWTEPYASSCRYFVNTTLNELQKLGQPEDVRLVFFFDN